MCDKQTEKGFPTNELQMEYYGCYKLGQYKSFDDYCISNFGYNEEEMGKYWRDTTALDYLKFIERKKTGKTTSS